MKLTKVDYKELNKNYKRTKVASLIEDFIDMNTAVVEITDFEHKTPNSCANSFNTSAKRLNHNYINARVIRNRVYLFNNSLIEKED
jgi:hypothetical protein